MILKVLASGSSGNCYLLSTKTETLILDCGIPIKEIKKGLNFDISKVVGCVTTHVHKDHSLAVEDFENMGINVFKPYAESNRRVDFGGFKIQAFQVPHDDVICFGFYINVDGQKIVYATDFEYIPYSFRNNKINHFLIECNYQKEMVGHLAENKQHILRGHAELQTTKQFIKHNNSSNLQNVILCHLSDTNCVAEKCVEEISSAVNCPVFVARKGLEIELKDCPF